MYMEKINTFFRRLYFACLVIGVIGIISFPLGAFCFPPIHQFGYGCLFVGVMAVVCRRIVDLYIDESRSD